MRDFNNGLARQGQYCITFHAPCIQSPISILSLLFCAFCLVFSKARFTAACKIFKCTPTDRVCRVLHHNRQKTREPSFQWISARLFIRI